MILNAKTQDARLIRKPRASGDDPNYDRFLYADTE